MPVGCEESGCTSDTRSTVTPAGGYRLPPLRLFCLVGSLCGTLKNEIPVINTNFEERQVTLFFKVSEETAATMKKIHPSPKSQKQRVSSSQVLVMVSQINWQYYCVEGGREDVLKFWRQQDCLLWQDISPELIVRDCVGQTRMEKRTRYIHLGFQKISLLHLENLI